MDTCLKYVICICNSISGDTKGYLQVVHIGCMFEVVHKVHTSTKRGIHCGYKNTLAETDKRVLWYTQGLGSGILQVMPSLPKSC